MRRIVPVLVGVLLLVPAVGQAQAAKEHLGSFIQVFQKPQFPHRVFLQVESSNHGDKDCAITLNGRTQEESLGTNGQSDLFNMFYLFKSGATKAYEQAKAAPSPTRRIKCSH